VGEIAIWCYSEPAVNHLVLKHTIHVWATGIAQWMNSRDVTFPNVLYDIFSFQEKPIYSLYYTFMQKSTRLYIYIYIILAQRIIFQRAPWSKLLVKLPKEWSGFCTPSVTTQYFEPKQQVQCPIKCWVSYSGPLSWNHSLLAKNSCSAGDNYSMRPLARCWCSPTHSKSSHNRKWSALYRFLSNFIFFVLNMIKMPLFN
jgi:hypothetical protein